MKEWLLIRIGKPVYCRQVRTGLELMTRRALWILSLFLLCLIFGVDVQAGTVQLPQTGQTKCYRGVSPFDEVSCAGTGQDGDKKTGVAWPSTRFITGTGLGVDCVTDSLTGLMWVKSPYSTTRTWSGAISHANDLSLCGFTDWRLPNVNEIASLVNAEMPDMAAWLNTQGFSNVFPDYYWSSTTYSSDPTGDSVLVAYMWPGIVYDILKIYNYYYAMPVRGGGSGGLVQLPATGQTTSYATGDDGNLKKGVAWPSQRFKDNGDGTVTDNLTGLVWLWDASCFEALTWDEALSGSNGLQSGQCDLTDGSVAGDWRLPNRNELRSLIDYSQSSPALPSGGNDFFMVQLDEYWTSTTSAYNTNSAWFVDIWSGNVGYGHKVDTLKYVWPVRDKRPVVAPNVPTDLQARTVSADTVKLTWTNNASSGTKFKIFRKTGAAAFTLLTTTAAGVTSYSDSTASGNASSTPYSYYLKACEVGVCSVATKQAIIPYKPTGIRASKLTGEIKLTWKDNSANETGFHVFRKDGSGAWERIAVTAKDVTSYSDTGVISGDTYQYKVRAFRKSDNKPFAFGYSIYTSPTPSITY